MPPPNTYILYNEPTSQFLKGGGHNPAGGYVLLLLYLFITAFPPYLSPNKWLRVLILINIIVHYRLEQVGMDIHGYIGM